MKFKEGDRVLTRVKGTAILAQKSPAVGTVIRALEEGHPDNWFTGQPEYRVLFEDLPGKGDLRIAMREYELKLAIAEGEQ